MIASSTRSPQGTSKGRTRSKARVVRGYASRMYEDEDGAERESRNVMGRVEMWRLWMVLIEMWLKNPENYEPKELPNISHNKAIKCFEFVEEKN